MQYVRCFFRLYKSMNNMFDFVIYINKSMEGAYQDD